MSPLSVPYGGGTIYTVAEDRAKLFVPRLPREVSVSAAAHAFPVRENFQEFRGRTVAPAAQHASSTGGGEDHRIKAARQQVVTKAIVSGGNNNLFVSFVVVVGCS